MPISKVIFKASSSATPEVWMDDTTNTNTAARVFSGDTGTLADGTHFTGSYTPPASVEVEELEVTENGTYTAPTGKAYSPVIVDVAGGGGGVNVYQDANGYIVLDPSGDGGGGGGTVARENDVTFIDYDGVILYSYSAEEALALTELPANPSHEGMTAEGWNWTLSQLQSVLTTIKGNIVIGQMYSLTDTEIDIYLSETNKSPYLQVAVNGTTSVDWGDGSTGTITGSSITTNKWTQHSYSHGGHYTIKLSGGSIRFIGAGDSSSSVLSPSASSPGSNNVYAISVRAIRLGSNASVGNYAFNHCSGLEYVIIDPSITSIPTQMCCYCYALKAAVLPANCTSIGSYAFYYCSTVEYVSMPYGVTSIGNQQFYECRTLKSIYWPVSIASIGSTTFGYNQNLKKAYVPSSVTSIGSTAFAHCSTLFEVHMLGTTPPSLSNTDAFSDVPAGFVIYVPSSTVNTYKNATNWSSYAANIEAEPA